MSGIREKYLAAALNGVKGVKTKVPFGASNRGAGDSAFYQKFHKKSKARIRTFWTNCRVK